MNLNDALTLIASKFDLDAQALIAYSAEDNIGGWDGNERLYNWAVGSLWSVEGKVLYALVRALKPRLCVEFGTWHGCSASHIAAALKANGAGKLFCVDNGGFGNVHIAPDLLPFVKFVDLDLFDYLGHKHATPIDFIFEDALHTSEQVEAVWSAAANGLLSSGGVIISHDAMHFLVGDDIQTGISAAGVTDVVSVLIEPGDCGLALWQKDDAPIEAFNGTPEQFLEALDATLQPGEQLVIEKPKRKPRTKAKVNRTKQISP